MLAGGIRMYRHEDYEQLKLELPFGVTLREDNRWVLLGKLFPWEAIERKYVENFTVAAGLFCRKMDGQFCRKEPDTDVRRPGRLDVAGIFCRTINIPRRVVFDIQEKGAARAAPFISRFKRPRPPRRAVPSGHQQ